MAVSSAVSKGDFTAVGNAVGNKLAEATVALATEGASAGVSKAVSALKVNELSKSVKGLASELKSAGSNPATVVGAELKGKTSIGTSGSIPGNIAPQLNSAAVKLGGVGTKMALGNTVGCCGEFRSANDLLLRNPSATPAHVNFTRAIRPRLGETVPMCDNCKIIFKKKN